MIIKNTIASDTFIDVSTGANSIVSGPNAISVSRDGGNFIMGPLSISSSFTKIRMGGIYKFNSLMAATMPSTIVSPVPTLEIDLPVKQTAALVGITKMIMSTVA